MPPIVSHIEIARPPDEVFAYVTDPSRFHEWQHDVMRVDIETAGWPAWAPGSLPPAGSVVPSG
jgi:uncharacterized protein YndB with AHSA1/START domain